MKRAFFHVGIFFGSFTETSSLACFIGDILPIDVVAEMWK